MFAAMRTVLMIGVAAILANVYISNIILTDLPFTYTAKYVLIIL